MLAPSPMMPGGCASLRYPVLLLLLWYLYIVPGTILADQHMSKQPEHVLIVICCIIFLEVTIFVS